MKKIFVFGILVLIFGVFVFGQERDTIKEPKVEKYQPQIDTLKAEFEKVKKDAYEKAIEGANRSINFSMLVMALVGLLVAGLGLVGYFKIKDVRAEMKKQLNEAQKIKEAAERCLAEIKGRRIEADELVKDLRSKVASQKEVQPTDFTKEITELTTKDASDAIKRYEDLSNRIFGKDIYWAMAYNYYKLGQFEKCIDELRKYLSLNPTDDNAYLNYGVALMNLGKNEEAIEKFKEAIRLNPKEANNWYNKACAHSLLKDKEKALQSLKKAFELDVKFKEDAKTDEDFKNFWEDADFKKLVG